MIALIREDPVSRALTWVAVLFFFLIEIVALNAFNLYLAGLAVLSLLMILASAYIGVRTSNQSALYDRSISPREARSTTVGVAAALALFVGYWLVAPELFALPASVVNTLAVSGFWGAIGVDLVYGTLQAIAEERFFRFGITNAVAAYTRSIHVGIFASGSFFWFYHLAAYFNNVQAQGLILVAGVGLAFLAFYFRRLLVPMFAHMIWNFVVVLAHFSVVPLPHLLVVLFG